MAERRKSLLPEEMANIMDSFRHQGSSSRPRIGINDRNFASLGTSSFMEVTDHSVTRTALFEASSTFNTSQSIPTDFLLKSASKRKSNVGLDDCTPKKMSTSTLPTTPGGNIDWSPACREQRNKLLETVDSRINDLLSMAAKHENFKKQIEEVVDSEKMMLERQREKNKENMKSMQDQLDTMRKQKYEAENARTLAENMLRDAKAKFDKEITISKADYFALDKKYKEIASEYHDVKQDLTLEVNKLKSELEMTKNISNQQARRLSLLEEEISEFRQRESKEKALREVLELKEIRIRDLESDLTAVQESLKIERQSANASMATRRSVIDLQDQLAQSKELVKGKILLEEQIRTLSEQANKADGLVQRVATLEQLIKTKDLELAEWHALVCSTVSEKDRAEKVSAQAVSAAFQTLEQTQLVLRNDLSEALSQLRSAQREKEAMEQQLRSEQERRLSLQSTAEFQSTNYRKMERKLQLIAKERDSIQQVLAAYEGDLTSVPNQMHQLQQRRIEAAERSAKEMREMVEKLEQEVATASGGTHLNKEYQALQEKLQMSETDLQNAKSRVASLEVMNEKLELLLEQRALRGDYNPQETKVLHFKMNPLTQVEVSKTEEIKQLREANDKLRERVRILQSTDSTASLNVTSVIEENLQIESNKQIAELQAQLSSQGLRNQRMLEAFKKTSKNFRQALYLLVGYKVDSMVDQTFRFTSCYAENEEDHLLFKVKEDDHVEMLATAFSDTIPELVSLHLNQQGSFPAFLSALTLDLFGRQSFTSH